MNITAGGLVAEDAVAYKKNPAVRRAFFRL
jgi:hypothetical protein